MRRMSQRFEGRQTGHGLWILPLIGSAALVSAPQAAPAQSASSFMTLAAKASAGCRAFETFSPEWALQERPAIPPEFEDNRSTVTTRADSQQKVGDTYKLLGHVEVTYRDLRITTDKATYNRATGEVVAQGDVILDAPKAHLKADAGEYNVLTGEGSFSAVEGYVHSPAHPRTRALVTENPFYVRAREVRRLDEDTYEVEDGRVSSCDDETTGWSLAVHRARLKVGDKAVSYGDVFRLLRVPVFYAPVLVHSIARNPRQTGFLLPQIGNSSQKGTIIGEGFFWAINSSADLLLGLENYSKRGLERSGRFRARPSATSELTVDYFGIHDRGLIAPITTTTTPGTTGSSTTTTVGRVSASGDSVRAVGKAADLGDGFRGVLDVDYINSLAFRLTFSNNFNQAVSSEARQTGFLTKNFDGYSLNFYAERYQDFLSTQQIPGNSIVIQHTPSVDFSSLDRQIGATPLYWSFDSSVAGLNREEPGFSTPALSDRVDFHPEISLRTSGFWGFHFTPSAGVDATRYGTSVLGAGHPLTRLLGDFSFDLRPPSLERVFNRRLHHYRLKHVIEPDIRYRLVRATDAGEIPDIVRFDETDILAETNEIEYSVKSTLFGRADISGDQADQPDGPQARELLSLSLTQKYYFDPTFGGALAPGRNVFEPTLDLTPFPFAQGRRLSPVVSVLKFEPFSNYDTELRADFSPSGGGVLNAGITSGVHHGDFSLQATDFFISREQSEGFGAPLPGTVTPSFNLLNARVVYGNASRKGLSAAFGINYNLSQRVANALVGQVTYNLGCLGLDVGYNRFNLGPLRDENQFRIALSLANVGSFGNLKSRDRLYK